MFLNKKMWTVEEDEFLVANYKHMCAKEIAKKMRRTLPAVYNRANKLGIQSQPGDKYGGRLWTREELELLMEMRSAGATYDEIAETLNRPFSSVIHYVEKFHIRMKKYMRRWKRAEKREVDACKVLNQFGFGSVKRVHDSIFSDTPHDLLARREGQTYAINVKGGYYSLGRNLERLLETGKVPAVLLNVGKKWFLLVLENTLCTSKVCT